MSIREIDWSTAAVADDGTFAVGLVGQSDRHWCQAFTAVAGLLDHASHNHLWGGVEAHASKTGDKIVVTHLEIDDPEHVESLREFLAAVTRQASADVPEPGAHTTEVHADSPAARSTRAFRALAPQRTR